MKNQYFITFTLFFVLFSCGEQKSKERAIDSNLKTISFKSTADTKAFFKWNDSAPKLVSAHRGGPYPGFPENSIEAFENVLKYTNAIIECDIAVTKDGKLIMMHDDKLNRTTTGFGLVKNKTWEEIQQLYLKDAEGTVTSYKVPSLEQVLQWAIGKAFLTLDIKRGVSLDKVNELIKNTQSEPYVAIITYNHKRAQEVFKMNPDLMISISARNISDVERIKNSGINTENLIAFTGVSEPQSEVYDELHKMGIFAILGALGNLDRRAIARGDQFYEKLYKNGADILATDRPLEVVKQMARR
ncbi:MAG: glycerophosphodiester phosphodiesterase family protein [Bacteroidota bacterium]